MAVRVQCPNPECGASLSVSVEAIGRRGRCPGCGRRLVVSASMDGAVASAWIDPTAPTSTPDPAPPEKLGRYEIRARLGSGAFGTVYRAYDPVMDREIALKVPREGLLETPSSVERFLREARAAARLRHPNIVPAHDAGSEDGRYYIASAFVRGTTLARAIDARGMDPRLAARVVRELADALQHAHELGIVHRDVKPANVILDPEGHAHLMDFGLARLAHSDARLTQVGSILGTPAYLAPEQATGRSAEADAASDQYSLGVTLFELLTGQTPFVGPIEVVLFATIHQQPPPPREINPDVPPDLEWICLKALAKKPAERYPNCRELAEDLGRWLAGEPVVVRPPEPEPSPITTAPTALPAALRDLVLDDRGPILGHPPIKPAPEGPAEVRPPRWPRRRIARAMLPILALAVLGTIAAAWRRPSSTPDPGQRSAPSSPPASSPPTVLAARPLSFTVGAIDPNRDLPAAELLDAGLQVPFKARGPVLDGIIGPDEYGPALAIRFDDDANPGRVYFGPKVAGPSDLFAWMYTAYTATDLYIAVRVRDDVHDAEDQIELYLDGDRRLDDFNWTRIASRGNNEGFVLKANLSDDERAAKSSEGVQPEEWAMARSFADDGHVFEVRVPLRLIDTKDGEGTVPATSGSTINFNLVVGDRDSEGPATRAALWHETDSLGPYFAGELAWQVKLHLGAIGLQVPYRAGHPLLDGAIGPGEYGPPTLVDFSDEENPGRLTHTWVRNAGVALSMDDLSYRFSSAYDDKGLFLAVHVSDDEVVSSSREGKMNDDVAFIIDGDRARNDYFPYILDANKVESWKANQEGFHFRVYAGGQRTSHLGDIGSSSTKIVPGGYAIEARIPLASIDTQDGPGERRPTAGSTLRFNIWACDVDEARGDPVYYGWLWEEDVADNPDPLASGEPSWMVDLHLARPVRYQLVDGPAGATLDADSGVFRWSPPPGSFDERAKIRVVDVRNPLLFDEATVGLKGAGSGPPALSTGRTTSAPPTSEGLLPPRIVIGESSISGSVTGGPGPGSTSRPEGAPPPGLPAGAASPPEVAASLPPRSDPPSPPIARSPAIPAPSEPGEGFVRLFNGRDLSGWVAPGDPALFRAEGGEIVARASSGPEKGFLYLSTVETFGDFTLLAKIKVVQGDSGIFLRGSRGDVEGSFRGIQVDAAAGSWGVLREDGKSVTPSSPSVAPDSLPKPGDWNEFRITALGDRVTVELNGIPIIDHANSKRVPNGSIALQARSTPPMEVHFKDIFLKRLGPVVSKPVAAALPPLERGYTRLYGRGDPSKQGWKRIGDASLEEEEGGVLVTRGGAGYVAYTRRQFGDFELLVDVQFSKPSDDSGIEFRIKRDASRPDGMGPCYEVQLRGDPAIRDPTGSLYLPPQGWYYHPARQSNLQFPIGQWNTIGVKNVGTSVEVWVNGRMAQAHTLPDADPGFIGLQHANSYSTVRFRNIRIRPL